MAFEYWESLAEVEKQRIVVKADGGYDGMHCFWCGAALPSGQYDKTTKGKLICKGECKQRRYFDNP